MLKQFIPNEHVARVIFCIYRLLTLFLATLMLRALCAESREGLDQYDIFLHQLAS